MRVCAYCGTVERSREIGRHREARKRGKFCSQHKQRRTRDPAKGCTKHQVYGVDGSNMREFFSNHKKNGTVGVVSTRCGHQGCTTRWSFRVDGIHKAEFCSAHKKDGMVDAISKKRCAQAGCVKLPSHRVDGSQTPRSCSKHKNDEVVNARNKRCVQQGCTTRPSYSMMDGTNRESFALGTRRKEWNGTSRQQPTPESGSRGELQGMIFMKRTQPGHI